MLVGSKGLLEIELYFKGIKAHSSNPEKGKSANINAIKFLYQLDDFYNKKIKLFEEKSCEVPYTTMNIGIINGGSAKNSIPANAYVTIDFRIANKTHINIIKEKIEELSKIYDCEIKIVETIEPFLNETKLVKGTKTANFITEASLVKNSQKIILGTGPITAHEVNEYVTEESYNKLVEQYKKLIKKVCK